MHKILSNTPLRITVHPYFRDRILAHEKTAVMVQENFTGRVPIDFFSIEGKREVLFATAIGQMAAILRIDAKTEKIERNIFTADGWVFKALQKDTIKKVIKNEGFAHTDDFWKNMLTRGVFIVTQIYFDTLKPINNAPTQPTRVIQA